MKEVVARTLFKKSGVNNQWYWHTKALNNEIVADGSEGYNNLEDAVKGFFVSQGISYHDNVDHWPDGYTAVSLSDNEYQINKHIN